jgi:hypothetical protein
LLLGNAGVTTSLSESDIERLGAKWSTNNATVAEEEASVASWSNKSLASIHNFCPEVSYEVFGVFVSSLATYADEIDRDHAHRMLAQERADRGDPRWRWSYVTPRHFSECREYSIYATIMSGSTATRTRSKTGRKPIPDKVRWEVFARDNFTCQYCGRKAPEVALVIDHKVSVKDGGDNETTNLTTACKVCNGGKGARSHGVEQ